MLVVGSSAPPRHFYPEFPLITMLVEILVGLVEKNKTSLAAILSLAPWGVSMVLGANKSHSGGSTWLTTIVLVSIYWGIGIGAAILTAKIARKASQDRVRR